jgi:glucokinase
VSSPVILGLDFGGTKIAVAVCDITGRRLGSTTVETLPELGAPASFARAIAATRALLRTVAAGAAPIAIGASTIGIPGDHGIALAPNLPGWDKFALGRELRAAFEGAEVRLVTDVKAAAQAEAELGALVDCDPGIYLNLGTGLAAAIVVGGRVVDGRHGASGEIGYNLRSVADVGVEAAARRPLEDTVSGYALLRDALTMAPETRDAAGVFARAPHDPKVGELLRSFVTELSFHVVNLAIAVDPARIVVGGGMVRSWHLIEVELRRALQAAVPYPPELVSAYFPYDAPLIGALALGTTAARARLTPGSTSMGRMTAALATASTNHHTPIAPGQTPIARGKSATTDQKGLSR